MLREIFTRQRQFINYFFDSLEMDRAEIVLNEFLACQGMIVFTGVGKSGIIADKLAKTMMSTGTRAYHLPPLDAVHGDIGMLTDKDLVVLISKSGQSDEVINIAKLMKKRGVRTIAWVSSKTSPLASLCDLVIYLPIEREICPFDLAPTTSTAIQLIFGDVIAVALMQAKKFSIDQYAMNHPAGGIGKMIAERVEDIMSKGDELPFCAKDQLLKEVLVELSQKRCGCLLVVDQDGNLEGIFTDGDLRRALEEMGEAVLSFPMQQLQTKEWLFATKEMLVLDALKLMEGERKVMMLPVLDGSKVVGLVHLHHILSKGVNLHEEQKIK
ncbi:MAG: KpsF/GutQ family sugar-phosphate isomerase [Chlamydiae bacterium]|nr:KpsF/GutQ family sugar-phosphate isomerase [Chlamydiota bacterium]